MRVIYKIETNGKVNSKAADIAQMVQPFLNCMFTEANYEAFAQALKENVRLTDESYPNVKPLAVDRCLDGGFHIYMKARGTMVARIYVLQVRSSYSEYGLQDVLE